MIAVRSSVSFVLSHGQSDPLGRYLILLASLNNIPQIILNTYAPNTDQKSSYKSVMHKLQHYARDQLIICGDFNDLVDPSLDSTNTKRKRFTALSSLLLLEHLYDPLRCQHGNEKVYSFYSHAQKTYSRIDLFFLPKGLLQQVSTFSVGVITWSDHSAVSISLYSPSRANKLSLWCINASLLSSLENREQLRSKITNFFISNLGSIDNLSTLWNAPKSVIQGIFLKIGAQEKKKTHLHR